MSDHQNSMVSIRGECFEVFMSEEKILRRVSELASQLNRDYRDKNPIFICVLNGAFMFYSDLMRRINVPCEVDFLKLSSYGENKISSGDVQLVKDLNCEVENRHIIIVEDIVDSGTSVNFIMDWIDKKHPASIHVVTLLHKPGSSSTKHPLDYVGFEIPSRFVIGYGLDYAQQGRNLSAVYILPEKRVEFEMVNTYGDEKNCNTK